MSEGYRHGEFVWCGWKLSHSDWMSSRLSVCFLSLAVCIFIHMCVKGTQVCPTFLQEKDTLPVSILPWKQKHIDVITDVFTAESSLDVGVRPCVLCNPSRDVRPPPFHGLGCWAKTRPTCSVLRACSCNPHRVLIISSLLLKDLKIYTAHTHTNT